MQARTGVSEILFWQSRPQTIGISGSVIHGLLVVICSTSGSTQFGVISGCSRMWSTEWSWGGFAQRNVVGWQDAEIRALQRRREHRISGLRSQVFAEWRISATCELPRFVW